MTLILGTRSPRRIEIMESFTLPFTQVLPLFDESQLDTSLPPDRYVREASEKKAESLSRESPYALILTADTIVVCEGKILGKPSGLDEGLEMLARLSGKWHTVMTSITGWKKEKKLTRHAETNVLFHETTEDQRAGYLKQLHCLDKAGAYGAQRAGSIMIKKIEGCFYNVMGLPINTLREVLMHFDIDLWKHLKQI